MDDAERLEVVRHLLRERDDDAPARLAAVLVLLFGQQVTRLPFSGCPRSRSTSSTPSIR
jgi:hypothetical protein